MMLLQFSLGELPLSFASPWGNLPIDGLMCGDFPRCLLPCSRPLFPKPASLAVPLAGSQGLGSAAVAGDSFPLDGDGCEAAGMVLDF